MRLLSLTLAAAVTITAPVCAQQALPHAMVYKSKADYSKYVAVELSADGTRVVYYPAPTDVSSRLAPVKLKGGYRLSKMGVSARTAYLNITIKEYSKLKQAPPRDEMMQMIKEKSPMTELWDCGIANEVTAKQLNEAINKKQLATRCRQIR